MDYGTIEVKEGDNMYEKKLNPNSPRYEAASIECEGGTGGIISMVNCSQFCEVYKVDMAFHIQTPEVLDPEQINPNMGFVKIEKCTIGCGNKIVARLMVQSQELLKILPTNINQMILSDKLYECKELLLICDKIAADISNEVNLINLKVSENKLSNVNRRIKNLPHIADLDDRVSRFLVNAKKYIQTLVEIFNIFFNEDVDGPRFDKVQKKLKTSVGVQNVLYKFVEETQPIIDSIVTYRNRMEHPKEGLEFIIRNYTLLPNGIIDVPVWYINGNEPIPIADEMEQITNYLLEFGEIFFTLCSLEKKQIPLPYRIIEIPEAKRDTKCPTRFSFEVDMEKYLSNNAKKNVSD